MIAKAVAFQLGKDVCACDELSEFSEKKKLKQIFFLLDICPLSVHCDWQ